MPVSSEQPLTFGNSYNYWVKTAKGVDLTRGEPGGKVIQSTKDEIIVIPSKSALVIVDMQNYFLHPTLSKDSQDGRESIPALMKTVEAAREAGMHVIWILMGLSPHDLKHLQPSYFMSSFKKDGVPLGENIGEIDGKPMGPKLFRGTWNSELYDELKPFAQKGVDAGTDVLIWKNRFSALHGQQPLETYLNDQGINSVFVCGVMTDVCVYGTWLDAYYKGYDAVYISDLSCTHNPQFVTQAAHLSAEARGWLVDSNAIISGLST